MNALYYFILFALYFINLQRAFDNYTRGVRMADKFIGISIGISFGDFYGWQINLLAKLFD